MSYFLSAFAQEAKGFKLEARLHSSTTDDPWAVFNSAVRALAKHGTIVAVNQVGNWNETFDIVEGKVSGITVNLYGPRYVDVTRRPVPREQVYAIDSVGPTSPQRTLVRQLTRELEEQADAHR